VYLKGDAGSSSDVLAEMNRALTALMQEAGFRVVVRRPHEQDPSDTPAHLIMVDLRGVCAVPPPADFPQPLPASLVLASSSVVNGKILPFSWLDCAALNRFLGPAISNLPDAEQSYIYGRAMARLLAHELYHVLGQTDDHTLTGISKARFSTADLLAEHFSFETAALEKLRPPAAEAASDVAVAGR
jgi:hypothetical protein